MREFAESFYKSTQWQACRESFLKSKRHLCENCLATGRYNPAEIVHHIVPLSPDNINNPDITLNWTNLQALCRECHGLVHQNKKRYKLDELGRILWN